MSKSGRSAYPRSRICLPYQPGTLSTEREAVHCCRCLIKFRSFILINHGDGALGSLFGALVPAQGRIPEKRLGQGLSHVEVACPLELMKTKRRVMKQPLSNSKPPVLLCLQWSMSLMQLTHERRISPVVLPECTTEFARGKT